MSAGLSKVAGLLFLTIAAGSAWARSAKAVRAFKHEHPCPYSEQQGCIVDHIIPLCAGGPDHPSNMQWQTIEAAKRKDRKETAQCRAQRRRG